MAALDSTLPELTLVGAPVGLGRVRRLLVALKTQVANARASEYIQVGGSRRFQARQRRTTLGAARVGLLVVVAAAGFDAVALFGLDFESTRFAIGIDFSLIAMALLGSWSLRRRLHRHPELVAGIATLALACSTVAIGTLVPSLGIQTIGYVLLVPGLAALVLPWRTRTHLVWLLGYTIIGCAYFALGNLERSPDERGDLVVVLAIAIGASLAGHVLLQKAQIHDFAQLERIGRLRRKSDRYMVELERLHHALELTAQTDPLTGTGNRRRLTEDLRALRAHIARSDFTYGIAELDLDHFKLVNDRYGHAGGDDVLQQVAHAIKRSLRAEDAIYRLGGEEFLVLLGVPDLHGLTAAAERLRIVVADLAIAHIDNGPHGTVTVSIGATFIGPADLDQTDDEWIARADGALYEAKGAGRNRVCVRQR